VTADVVPKRPAPAQGPLSPLRLPRRAPAAVRGPNVDYDVMTAARRIIEDALCVVRGERVLVVVDRARRDVGVALAAAVREVGATCALVELEALSSRPVPQVLPVMHAALESAQASVLLVGFVDDELPMRLEYLERVRTLGLRHAHMVGVSRRSIIAGFSVDPQRVRDVSRAVRMRLRPDSVLRLKTPLGSDLTVRLEPSHRVVEHVGVIRPGKWQNLPSGELMTAPRLVDGVFVCDASMGASFGEAAGLLTRTPVRLDIAASAVTRVSCSDRGLQRAVETFVRSEPGASRVGTAVIGTNVGIASATGELVCDQNLPGLHISLGNTFPLMTGALATTRAQLTLTCCSSNVDLDGAPLLRGGRYMIG
jgi:hypothetical protein